MKKSTRVLSLILAMMMLFSAFSILASAKNVDVAETSATVSSDGTARLYFNMAAVSWWNTSSAGGGNYAYFFNNSTNKNAWSTKAVAYSGNTYYVTIPSGDWAGVILTRNSVTTNPSWSNKWNQTGDITMSSTSNYISKFADGSTSVTWGTQKPTSTATVTASKTTMGVGGSATLNTVLATNANINTIKSVTYTATNGTVTDGMFTADAVGEATITATVTYHPNCYSSLTSTATATTTITVTEDGDTSTEVPTEAPTEAPTEPPTQAPTVIKTAYCINSVEWTNLTAHSWIEGGAGTAWPGEVMTKTDLVDKNGFDVYEVTFYSDYEMIIFNNGNNGKQTADLTFEEGKYYDLKTGAWYASLDEVPSTDPLSTDRYLLGSFNEWNALANEFKLDVEGSSTGYVSLELAANTTYEFKVIREGAWTSNATTITGDVSGLTFSSSTDANCKITTKAAGTYVFSFGMSNSQLSVTYPVEVTEPPVVVDHTFTYEITADSKIAGMNYEVVYDSNVFTLKSVDYGCFADTAAITNSAADGKILLTYSTEEDSMELNAANVITAVFEGPEEYAVAPKMYVKEIYSVDSLLSDVNIGYSFVETFDEVVTEGTVEAQTPTEIPTEAPTEEPTEAPVETMTIYFENNWMWPDAKIYWWGSSVENPAWPGVDMTYVDSTEAGYKRYVIEVPTDVTGIIFNGTGEYGAEQSADITEGWYDGICYYMTYDAATNTKPCGSYKYEPIVITPTDAPATGDEPATDDQPTEAPIQYCEPGYYLVGTLNGVDCWSITSFTADRMLQPNPGNEGEYMLDWTFVGGDELKVAYTDGYAITKWFNDGGKNYNIGADSNKVGDGTLYFRPEGNADWSYEWFTVIPKEVPVDPTDAPATPDQPATEAPATDDQPEVGTMTIYFENNWQWPDAKIYWWGSSVENPEWPGKEMTYVDEVENGKRYVIEVPTDITGMLFNGTGEYGAEQSADITEGWYDGICYYMTYDEVTNTKPCGSYKYEPVVVEPTDAPATPDQPASPDQPTEAPIQYCEPGYYLVGTLNGVDCWSVPSFTADRMLVANPGNEGEYMLDYTFTEGDEIKVVYTDGYAITKWFNDGGDNYTIGAVKAGEGTLYFRPEGNDTWSYFYFTVLPKEVPVDPTDAPATPDQPATEAPTDAPATDDQPEVGTMTIYFENNWQWPDAKIYWWGSSVENPEWPGKEMTYVDEVENGKRYVIEVPTDITGMLFNGTGEWGAEQSADITEGWYDGICYYMTYDSVTNTKPCGSYKYEPVVVEPTVEPTEEPTVEPTEEPTEAPTETPSEEETEAPTQAPTQKPTQAPTEDTRGNVVQNIQVVETSSNTVSLSWDQLEDCFKYWVYKYNDATDAWTIATTAYTNSAVVKNLAPNTTYKFKITAKYASDNGVTPLDVATEFEATTAAPAVPGEIIAGLDLDQIVLTWDEVPGATKYWLYKSTSPDGPFAINGSTRTNSIAVKKFFPETTYYFKVTSYTMQNGIPCISDVEDSPIIEVTTPSASAVATVLETKNDTTATISWPLVETATKYWVYYSTTTNDTTDMSQWKLYNSVSDMSVNTMTIRKLTPNTKYFVTVKVLYTNTSGEPKEYIYTPTGLITTYSSGEFLTFADHPQNSNYFTITWPEDAALEGKVWVWRYDADGNRTIVNSVTGTNTLNVKKFDGYEDCYYELETFIATGMYGYLTPVGGEKYHAE